MNSGKDLINEFKTAYTMAPAALAASANHTAVDLRSTGPEFTASLILGATTGTSTFLDVKLQESDDNSSYADISGATFTQKTQATGASLEQITVSNRTARYVRAVSVVAGTSPVFYSALLIQAPKASF